jgi:hypothetical protein
MACSKRPGGVTTLSLFFAFGATMASCSRDAVISRQYPGADLAAESSRARSFRSHGMVGSPADGDGWRRACAAAAVGLLQCMRWGYWAPLAVLGVNLVGDAANALLSHDWRTLIGLPIGAAMILYLVRNWRIFDA